MARFANGVLLQVLFLVAVSPAANVSGQQFELSSWTSAGRKALRLLADTDEAKASHPFCTEDLNDTETCSTSGDDWNGTYIDHCRIVSVEHNLTGSAYTTGTISRVASSLSFVGGVWTLVTYAVVKQVRNPSILIEVQLAIGCLIMNIKSFVEGLADSYDPISCCPSAACQTEAAVDNFAGMSVILWSGCITIQAYLLIVVRMSPKAMDQTYKFFYIAAYGVPVIFTLWPLFAGYFGPAGGFCWIPSSRVWQQVMFYYGWLFVVDTMIAAMLTHIGFAVRGTKSTGVINRFIAYAVWSVVATFGFIVYRSREWANPCTDSPFFLSVWNSIFFPSQGLGYAIIFTINENVKQGWKEVMQCNKKKPLSGEEKGATFGSVEMSEVNMSNEDIVKQIAEDGYSSDDSD